jgi:large subunit ribosomal protein L7/L12
MNVSKLTKEEFFAHLDGLTVLELADYIKEFETRYGVSAAAAPSASPLSLFSTSSLNGV